MIRFGLLGSGSKGNAVLIASESATILIDNGLSYRQARLRASAIGQNIDDLDAVLVTHEHGDHVRGLGVLARKTRAPVYMTSATYSALPDSIGQIVRREFFEAGEEIAIKDLTLQSFSVSHDAADPVSFVVGNNGTRLGIAYDLGYASHLVKTRLARSHALILESNYCPEMLRMGPYPPLVQQRIRGRQGHLSNVDMQSLLAGLLHDGLQEVVLAHISQENNKHDHACGFARTALAERLVRVTAAEQDRPTRLFEVRG